MAGRAAAHDRNGTETVIRASRYLETDAQILIHFQAEQGIGHQATNTINDYVELLEKDGDPDKVTIEQIEFPNYQDVYKQGDVLLLPRRYGGNCLPLNEALSIGMPAIMTDVSPNNQFLPPSWLVPAQQIANFTPRTSVDIYGADIQTLAARVDEFYRLEEPDMIARSLMADILAQRISWETMKPQYEKALYDLCT